MECQDAASGPVSASPSPTTQAHDQVGIVERGAIGMHQRVAELAAFVDRARRFRRGVARNAAGKGELPEQLAQAVGVAA